jgi:hypothetical protein
MLPTVSVPVPKSLLLDLDSQEIRPTAGTGTCFLKKCDRFAEQLDSFIRPIHVYQGFSDVPYGKTAFVFYIKLLYSYADHKPGRGHTEQWLP